MRRTDMQVGAECYYATGEGALWRVLSPKKAVIVSTNPVRVGRYGGWQPHPDGTGIVVDLHEISGVRRTAVYRRHLRGLWMETLSATGRTEAGVLAYDEGIKAIARSDADAGEALLALAARESMDDGAFVLLAQAVDGRPIGC